MIVRDSIVKNLKVNNDKVIQRKFSGKELTKPETESWTHQFQDRYKSKNLTPMTGINIPYGFRNSKQFNTNEDPQSVDDYDWDTTNAFVTYGWKSSESAGGCGEKPPNPAHD